MSSPGLLNATREEIVLPDTVDTIDVTASSATINYANCGDTTGGRDLSGKWVYIYANGTNITFLHGTYTVTLYVGQTILNGTAARVYFPVSEDTNFSIVGGGIASITIAYSSVGGGA